MEVAPNANQTEAARQLAAAVERHREVAASMQEPGRPETGQHVAVKAVARAVHLVSFALKGAAEAGVPFERLVELTGLEPDLVRAGLATPAPEPQFVARLAPAGPDPQAVAEAAAAFESLRRLDELSQRMRADAEGQADASLAAGASQVDDLRVRLEAAWRAWREALAAERGPQTR